MLSYEFSTKPYKILTRFYGFLHSLFVNYMALFLVRKRATFLPTNELLVLPKWPFSITFLWCFQTIKFSETNMEFVFHTQFYLKRHLQHQFIWIINKVISRRKRLTGKQSFFSSIQISALTAQILCVTWLWPVLPHVTPDNNLPKLKIWI